MTTMPKRVNCPVDACLSLIGGKYKTLVLWHLLQGGLRFSQLQRLIPHATPKMLTQQLRELERDKLLRRKVYPVAPPRVEYFLTKTGGTLAPMLHSMFSWGSGYLEKKGSCPNCSMTQASA